MGCCVTQLPECQPPREDSKTTTKPAPADNQRKRRNGCTQHSYITKKKHKKHEKKAGHVYVSTPREDPDDIETSAKQQQIEIELKKQQEEKERIEREQRIKQERERKEREEKERKERERKEKRARIRKNAMRELLTTEETYVNLLKECIDTFVDPLLLRPDLLSDKIENAHRVLFSDIKIIYGVNSAFLSDLQLKIGDDHLDNESTQIGDDFARFTPYFRAYQSYLNNYDSASMLLSRVTQQERNKYLAFNEWYNDQRAKYCDNKSLDFYLILPIQRLPRYKLCLTEIIKNTECDHKDLSDLNIALQSISDVTMICNDRMKEYESRAIVRDIEIQFVKYSAVDTCLVTPSRRFIKEGTLYRITRKGDSHKLTFYLFNDLLCYASEQSISNYSNSKLLRLQMRMQIDDIFHVKENVQYSGRDKYDGRGFEIHSAVKSFIVYAENVEDKKEWLQTLKECMENIQKGVKYGGRTRYEVASALWIPDDWSDCCMVSKCKKKFNSITMRRHHCRWCGRLICRECARYRLRHKIHINNMIKPVCVDCYEMHHTRFRANTCAQLYCDDEDDAAIYEGTSEQPQIRRSSVVVI